MSNINPFGHVNAAALATAAAQFGTPLYVYDEAFLIARCRELLAMPNAFGLRVRYAMKANANRSLLQILHEQGIGIDASSLNEARRAHLAGVPLTDIILTTQEVQQGADMDDLQSMMLQGMQLNICSLRQLYEIGDFARENGIDLSIRIHPGAGAGESASRNTGDDYCCFGIHRSDWAAALAYADDKGLRFTQVHEHIGSGGDPESWRQNIDLQLGFVEAYFPDAHTVSFGGGLKEARMPDETAADVAALGTYAKERVADFAARTGRKLYMEIEPGTFFLANAGYAVTEILDQKCTGESGLSFLVANGGMEINARPLLYGSRHPFYLIRKDGALLSSDWRAETMDKSAFEAVLVGRCCESGDAQSLDETGRSLPRRMAQPETGDLAVIGGAGAYCAAMSPFNYNSHVQAAEVLHTTDGALRLIRRRQTLEQIIQNEII